MIEIFTATNVITALVGIIGLFGTYEVWSFKTGIIEKLGELSKSMDGLKERMLTESVTKSDCQIKSTEHKNEHDKIFDDIRDTNKSLNDINTRLSRIEGEKD